MAATDLRGHANLRRWWDHVREPGDRCFAASVDVPGDGWRGHHELVGEQV
jgi:hypothetical protein